MNAAADDTKTPADAAEGTTRLTLQTPNSIHKRVKIGAAELDSNMLAVTLEMYRARFMGADWPQDIVDQVLTQLVRQADAGAFQWPATVVSSVRGQIDSTDDESAGTARK
ncbi:hypothetical protein [Nocardia brasiliensis]|uniref:hypothetical protein n=1 Tax=Nocardia brasiliensis TaxID=37326 RepID=UPI002456BCF5|nr:hypothetical protein [Nocardia brasiliensis]